MYVGRFAPSPTGPLHFGSLVTALASYSEARVNHGQWLVRIEDLDKPREVPGASQQIIDTLEAFGFIWDANIAYQSERTSLYAQAFDQLNALSLVYPCTCTRKEIADSSQQHGIESLIYPKTCLLHPIKENISSAWRVKTSDHMMRYHDLIQGWQSQNLATDIGDFIVKRADGMFAYQLAVVVDDALQGITHVVRGADLLQSTPRQRYLQSLLKLPTLNYAHVPLVTNSKGQKLSKQTLANPINPKHAIQQLIEALRFLNQSPPAVLYQSTIQELWNWVFAHWKIHQVPKHQTNIYD